MNNEGKGCGLQPMKYVPRKGLNPENCISKDGVAVKAELRLFAVGEG